MRKTLLLLLGVVVALPALARDFTYTYESQTLTYTVIDEDAKTCETKQGKSNSAGNPVSGTLVIPSIAKDGETEYTVTQIGMGSFTACTELTSVDIPNTVTKIMYSAFFYCPALATINLPNSVTQIEGDAFSICTSLKSIEIPNSVISIEYRAFSGCTGLTSIIIPRSVTKIGSNAFGGCSSLKEIIVDENNTAYSSVDGVLFSKDRKRIMRVPATKEGEFYIPNSVTSIGEYAFSSCVKLTSVLIPTSVRSISEYAFSNCANITSIIIPSSVSSISDHAFSNCSALTSMTIEDSDTEVRFGTSVFYNTTNLKTLYLGRNFSKSNNSSSPFEQSSITELTISSKVTELCYGAFKDCVGLTKVTLPESIKTIGGDAFSGCNGIESVICLSEVPPTIDSSFEGLYDTAVLSVPDAAANDYMATK